MLVSEVRDLFAELLDSITCSELYCYKSTGKLNNSIGIYNSRNDTSEALQAVGSKTSYTVKPITLLIHGSKRPSDTEQLANEVYTALDRADLTNTPIKVLKLVYEAPIDVGTDDTGVYEYTIDAILYLERNEHEH